MEDAVGIRCRRDGTLRRPTARSTSALVAPSPLYDTLWRWPARCRTHLEPPRRYSRAYVGYLTGWGYLYGAVTCSSVSDLAVSSCVVL